MARRKRTAGEYNDGCYSWTCDALMEDRGANFASAACKNDLHIGNSARSEWVKKLDVDFGLWMGLFA